MKTKFLFDMKKITAIPTVYKNRTFRSRLEVRWAIYFDSMGIKWDYEPEGFRLSDGSYYLPDFWLPESGWYAEVKPMGFQSDPRHTLFGDEQRLMVLVGPPTEAEYIVVSGRDTIRKKHKGGEQREYALKIMETTNFEHPQAPIAFSEYQKSESVIVEKVFPFVERFESGEDVSISHIVSISSMGWSSEKCPITIRQAAFSRKKDHSILCFSCCKIHKSQIDVTIQSPLLPIRPRNQGL